MKILYAEDDEGFQDIMTKELTPAFGDNCCLVVPSMDQYESIIRKIEYNPDVILMDIVLPKNVGGPPVPDGGIQLIEKGFHKDIPVIFVSMWSSDKYEDRRKILSKGFFDKGDINFFEEVIQTIRKLAIDESVQLSVAGQPKTFMEVNSPYSLETLQNSADVEAYAVAQIKDLPESKQLICGNLFLLQAGIQKEEPLCAESKSSAIKLPIETKTSIDIAIRAEDMDVAPSWLQQFEYEPMSEECLIDFRLTPNSIGEKKIIVEFYYNRHWLTQIQFEVEIIN